MPAGPQNRGCRMAGLLRACFLVTIGATQCAANWWNLGFLSWKANHRLDQTLILSAQPTCSSIAGLSPKQAQFCQNHFSLMPAVTYGARLGMHECLNQFRVHKWNCATLKSGVAFGPVADDATKEASFAHAVASAGVVHAVSRACKRAAQDGEVGMSQLLSLCGCSRALRPKSLHRDWIWGGCGDDIMFGYKFSKEFIDAKETEQNHPRHSPELARTLINLHNNEVGRRLVFKSSEVGCKCHGVSGSCSLRTCWQQLRPFAQVGEQLMFMYGSAIRVKLTKKGTDIRRAPSSRRRRGPRRPRRRSERPPAVLDEADEPTGPGDTRGQQQQQRRRRRRPDKMELVFLKHSPDYCSPNATLGILGTQNRECSLAEEDGPDACRNLCCGRGHETRLVREVRRCHCKFEWCCQVKCRECEEEKRVYICK